MITKLSNTRDLLVNLNVMSEAANLRPVSAAKTSCRLSETPNNAD